MRAFYFLIVLFSCSSIALPYEAGEYIIAKDGRKIFEWQIAQAIELSPNMNNGGCGLFAYYLFSQLDSCQYELTNISGNKHFAVSEPATGRFIDAMGFRDTVEMSFAYNDYWFETIPIDSLRLMVWDSSIWNKQFDRSSEIPFIRVFLHSIFDNVMLLEGEGKLLEERIENI